MGAFSNNEKGPGVWYKKIRDSLHTYKQRVPEQDSKKIDKKKDAAEPRPAQTTETKDHGETAQPALGFLLPARPRLTVGRGTRSGAAVTGAGTADLCLSLRLRGSSSCTSESSS